MTSSADGIARLIDAIELPASITDLTRRGAQITAEHGPDAFFVQHGQYLLAFTAGRECPCGTCADAVSAVIEAISDDWIPLFHGMILCSECGNKRCPHAWHHDNVCTGSNEPGQTGSVA